MFIAALVQKQMKKKPRNKGHTVFICDDNKQQMSNFSDALYQADPWFDPIYQSRKTKKGKTSADERFDQIINTGFAIKSEHSSLVQVADAVLSSLGRVFCMKSTSVTVARWPSQALFSFAKLISTLPGAPSIDETTSRATPSSDARTRTTARSLTSKTYSFMSEPFGDGFDRRSGAIGLPLLRLNLKDWR